MLFCPFKPFDFFQFTIPEGGLRSGEAFGLGDTSPFAEYWEDVGNTDEKPFELSTDGDQFFIYCLDADNVPNFLWGYSYNDAWEPAGLSDEEYGEGKSALPPAIENLGNLVLPHMDNCVYEGALAGRKTELQKNFMDPLQFTCLNDLRIELDTGEQRSSTRALSIVMTGAMALAAAVAAWMI